MKKTNKVISIFISVILCLTMLPLGSIVSLASDEFMQDTSSDYYYGLNDVQKEELDIAVEKWNSIFIDNNSNISSVSGEEKEYYILKTIYNFVTRNTKYNSSAYDEYFINGSSEVFVHTAYAAMFGNNTSSTYDWTTKNTANLLTINKSEQGVAVCDGYARLFEYLCRYNNIECQIVVGTKNSYIEVVDEIRKDDHAWNIVKIGSLWYHIDATYASSSNAFGIDFTNYDYFLRGTSNTHLTIDGNHQEILLDKNYPYSSMSKIDYDFSKNKSINSFNNTTDYILLWRNPSEDSVNLDNIILIKQNSDSTYSYYSFEENTDKSLKIVPCQNGLAYAGSSCTYKVILSGYASEEYSYSFDTDSSSVGTHSGYVFDTNNSIEFSYFVGKFDMSNSLQSVTVNGIDDETNSVAYTGNHVNISASIIDPFGNTLIENEDYIVSFNDEEGNLLPSAPILPGKYSILVDFIGDTYSGKIKTDTENDRFHFNIAYLNLASYNSYLDSNIQNKSLEYTGSNVISPYIRFSYNNQTFEKDIDYRVVYDNGEPINIGTYTYHIEAISTSKYLCGLTNTYICNVVKDITASDVLFSLNSVTANSYDFTLTYNNYVLQNGIDYTATVTDIGSSYRLMIIGIGNYHGSITVDVNKPITQTNTTTQTVAKPTVKSAKLSATTYCYDKKVHKPSVKVVNSNGNVLKNGTDYKLKYSNSKSKNVGSYTVTVTYIGAYSGSKKLTYTIGPKTKPSISSLSTKSKSITAKWKKNASATGYQLQIATNSSYTKNNKSFLIKKNSTTSAKLSKLTKGKKYYVRIRTYKTVKGKKCYGAWSKSKTINCK